MKITKDGFCFYFEGARRVIGFDKSSNAPMKKWELIDVVCRNQGSDLQKNFPRRARKLALKALITTIIT